MPSKASYFIRELWCPGNAGTKISRNLATQSKFTQLQSAHGYSPDQGVHRNAIWRFIVHVKCKNCENCKNQKTCHNEVQILFLLNSGSILSVISENLATILYMMSIQSCYPLNFNVLSRRDYDICCRDCLQCARLQFFLHIYETVIIKSGNFLKCFKNENIIE